MIKSLTVQIPIDDGDAELLASKYILKELEGVCIRECLHVLGALVSEIKQTIPYIEPEMVEE